MEYDTLSEMLDMNEIDYYDISNFPMTDFVKNDEKYEGIFIG